MSFLNTCFGRFLKFSGIVFVVLLPNMDSKNKRDMPYDPRPHIVVEKKGSMVTAQDDDGSLFSLSTKALKDQPFLKIRVHGTPLTVMADSGASINILDEKEYCRLPNRPNLEPSSVKTYSHQSKVPLRVLGKFTTALESKTKKLSDKLYVVEGSCGSLLSWKTSQGLNLLQTVQQIGD